MLHLSKTLNSFVGGRIKSLNKSDICVWVNSIAPLQTSLEIKKVINFFIKKNLNSLITVVDKKIHTVFC